MLERSDNLLSGYFLLEYTECTEEMWFAQSVIQENVKRVDVILSRWHSFQILRDGMGLNVCVLKSGTCLDILNAKSCKMGRDPLVKCYFKKNNEHPDTDAHSLF